jgi:hypothetical protein
VARELDEDVDTGAQPTNPALGACIGRRRELSAARMVS